VGLNLINEDNIVKEKLEVYGQMREDIANVDVNRGASSDRAKGFYAEIVNSSEENISNINKGIKARQIVIDDNGNVDAKVKYSGGNYGRGIQDKCGRSFNSTKVKSLIESGKYDGQILRINCDSVIFMNPEKLEELCKIAKKHNIKIVAASTSEREMHFLAKAAKTEVNIRKNIGLSGKASLTATTYVTAKVVSDSANYAVKTAGDVIIGKTSLNDLKENIANNNNQKACIQTYISNKEKDFKALIEKNPDIGRQIGMSTETKIVSNHAIKLFSGKENLSEASAEVVVGIVSYEVEKNVNQILNDVSQKTIEIVSKEASKKAANEGTRKFLESLAKDNQFIKMVDGTIRVSKLAYKFFVENISVEELVIGACKVGCDIALGYLGGEIGADIGKTAGAVVGGLIGGVGGAGIGYGIGKVIGGILGAALGASLTDIIEMCEPYENMYLLEQRALARRIDQETFKLS